MRKTTSIVFCLAIAAAMLSAAKGHADEVAVRKALASYAEAFNKQDAKASGAIWSATATHTDRVTGERTEGREAIQADLAKTFEARSQARLSASIDRIRMIKPDVASVEGQTSLGVPGEDPEISAFSAILIKEGDSWLIDSVEELPAAPVSTSALKDLEWLIGKWVDESAEGRVESTYRWAADGAFLLHSFVAQHAEGEKHQGTQVIGWDPRGQQIRSWTFNSDGSFGEATWSKSDSDWLVKSTSVLPDGRAAAGTFVMTKVDDNSRTVQLIGHSIEGEPQPSSEVVKVVRAAATAEVKTDAVPAPSNK
jgi:uncharacterized protein (TIGR02246 family)